MIMEPDHSHQRERGDIVQSAESSATFRELHHGAQALRWHRLNTLDNSGRTQAEAATVLFDRNE